MPMEFSYVIIEEKDVIVMQDEHKEKADDGASTLEVAMWDKSSWDDGSVWGKRLKTINECCDNISKLYNDIKTHN